MLEHVYQQAADAILAADALLIGAGAGMGVDSGLPDFRGRRFEEISNPVWFQRDPEQAWGFFGHRLHLYRATLPHAGFEVLRRWGESRPLGYFVYTSNVDGQFHRAGFSPDRILECHGSIHFLQCVEGCTDAIWPADDTTVLVNEITVCAAPPLPQCSHCGRLARPNVLMFGDGGWIAKRSEAQQERYRDWLASLTDKRLAVIELGAGTFVPTVRCECEAQAGQLIRVNPRDTEAPPGSIVLPVGALQAIQTLEKIVALPSQSH